MQGAPLGWFCGLLAAKALLCYGGNVFNVCLISIGNRTTSSTIRD